MLHKSLLLTVLLLFSLSSIQCTNLSDQDSTNSQPVVDTASYETYLKTLEHRKTQIDSGDYASAGALLFQALHDETFTYWSGTPWDFNGTTQQPRKGTIACGYYLTTLMKQTGFDIQRIYMAQQASSVLIKAYCTDIRTTGSLENVKSYLETQPDSSVFIIGLDFHTGFVTKCDTTYHLIHSNYISNQGVVKERLDEAHVLTNNSFFMIGNLSTRKDRIAQWMKW